MRRQSGATQRERYISILAGLLMSPQRQLRSRAFRLSTNRQGSHITSSKGSVSADTSRINSAVCLVPSVLSSIDFSTAACVLVLVSVYEP